MDIDSTLATLKEVRDYLGTDAKPVSIAELKELDESSRNELRKLVGIELGKGA